MNEAKKVKLTGELAKTVTWIWLEVNQIAFSVEIESWA
jgi:hypothetical protein